MRRVLSGAVLGCLIANTAAGAAPAPIAPPPSASPSPSPSVSPDACTHGDTIIADEAFAREIDDARTLAFLTFAENIPKKDRAAVNKRAGARLPKETTDTIAAALGNACDTTEVDYRATRLAYMLAKRWSDDEGDDDEEAGRNAIAALFLGDRIPASVRDAALAVFGTSIAQLDAMALQAETPPTPSPSSTPGGSACNYDAKTLLAISPVYPYTSMRNGVSGVVQLSVALDVHGYVEAVTVFKTEFHPAGADGADIVTAAIDAAGSSNFAPQFVDCKPRAGKYLYRADFTRR